MIAQFNYAFRYLKHQLRVWLKKDNCARSEFLSDLFLNVITDQKKDQNLQKVIKVYDKYKRSNKIVEYTEIGAGSNYTQKKNKLGQIIKRSSVSKKYGILLYKLCQYNACYDILEIGTSVGISTAYIAQSSQNLNFKTIEGVEAKSQIAKNIASELNQSTTFITGDFDKVLDDTLQDFEKLDFVFFDGNHTKKATLNYFNKCFTKIHNNTIFVFDDIHWSREMEEAWIEILNHQLVKVSVDLFFMGLIFFKQDMSKEQYVLKI